ncbi:hypothetical protein [Micromonospora sp. KC723]|uniref:hypothetical protein n=1 Tax=Micromonospora sp. KC723 TaxID=2530381 RepID=UPI0010463C54|nr:hypothetical protein [Micromonospora sp. KC723]TDB75808.1 hypothetical protein E1165_09670 [Micromonospora sp. KC723]
MSVRRQVARLVTAGALLGGLLAAGAASAYADEGRVTARTSPAAPTLGKEKSIEVRHRVAFVAGTAVGRLGVAGEATTAAAPTATPRATGTPVTVTDGPALAVLVAPSTGQATAAAVESSGGSMIMWFGVALVAVGVGLIALLIRNNRKDRAWVEERSGPPAVPLPRNPGPTTYRSRGGLPRATPAPTARVYGQQPAAAPTTQAYGQQPAPAPRVGSLYGSAGAYPAVTPGDRPAGGVYGAPAALARSHPAPSGPVPPPVASGPTVPPGRPSPAPHDPSPADAGGDSTSVMPGLPG